MRIAVVFGVVALAAAAHADPAADQDWAERFAMTARSLARRGHCPEALRLQPRIEKLDAEVWHRAATEDMSLAACVSGTPLPAGTRFGPPSTAPIIEREEPPTIVDAPPLPPESPCQDGGYLEPALMSYGGETLTRVAAGALMRACGAPIQARLGVSLSLGRYFAIGVESEVTRTIADHLRIGGRVGAELTTGYVGNRIYSVDLRLHVHDAFWLSAGGFLVPSHTSSGGLGAGLTFGVGFEGRPGAIIAGVELGVGILAFLLVLNALSHETT